MYFKIGEFVPKAKIVAIYTYEVCDSNGNVIASPASDFLNSLYSISAVDAQIIKSQILNTANKYGIRARDEQSTNREGLFALPSKYDEINGKISSEYRMYYWVLNKSTIIIGGGCFKPQILNGKKIKAYQEVPDCEHAADELCRIANHIELLIKKGTIFLDEMSIEIDEEILEI